MTSVAPRDPQLPFNWEGNTMPKFSWMLWLLPVAVWAVYMCWASGYQAGYTEGHEQAWVNARSALTPRLGGDMLTQHSVDEDVMHLH